MECLSLKISLVFDDDLQESEKGNESKKFMITDSSNDTEQFSVWQLQANKAKVVLLKTLCLKDSEGNSKIKINHGLKERGVNVVSLSSGDGSPLGETKASFERSCCGGSEVLVYRYFPVGSKKASIILEPMSPSQGTMQMRVKDQTRGTFAQLVCNDQAMEMGIDYLSAKFSNLSEDIRYTVMALAVGMLDSNYECEQELIKLRRAATGNAPEPPRGDKPETEET